MKICFSISCYDAFEDLNISADLIRSNWDNNHELYLVAGLCKPATSNLINSNFFNDFIEIETPETAALKDIKNQIELRYTRSRGKQKKQLSLGEPDDELFEYSATARLFNSMIKTGKKAIANNCDYIIYLNSGSWILDISCIFKIIQGLNDRTFAIRMVNRLKYIIPDDHFLVVNLNKASKLCLYDINYNSRLFNPVALYLNGIHGVLMIWLNQVPYGDIYVYSNHDKSIDAFGNTPYTFNPLIFDPKYKLLHSNIKFGIAQFLRRKYIKKYVNKISEFVQNYLDVCPPVPKGHKYIENPDPHLNEKFFPKKIIRIIKYIRMYFRVDAHHSKLFWEAIITPYDKSRIK